MYIQNTETFIADTLKFTEQNQLRAGLQYEEAAIHVSHIYNHNNKFSICMYSCFFCFSTECTNRNYDVCNLLLIISVKLVSIRDRRIVTPINCQQIDHSFLDMQLYCRNFVEHLDTTTSATCLKHIFSDNIIIIYYTYVRTIISQNDRIILRILEHRLPLMKVN